MLMNPERIRALEIAYLTKLVPLKLSKNSKQATRVQSVMHNRTQDVMGAKRSNARREAESMLDLTSVHIMRVPPQINNFH